MVKVEINEDIYKRLVAFIKVIDVILEEKLPNINAYADLVLSIGIDKMLQDVLPKDELLSATMIAMFRENPEFVASFVAKTLREGNKVSNVENTKQTWMQMVT